MPSRSIALACSVVAGALVAGACTETGTPGDITRAEPRTDSTASSVPSTVAPSDGTLVLEAEGQDPDLPAAMLVVGDSVLVLIADELADRIDTRLVIDGADCRRIDAPVDGPCGGVPPGATVASGVDAIVAHVAAMRARGTPPGAGIVVLANNSSLSSADLDAAMVAFGPVDQVWWVNTRIDGFGRQDPNNDALAALAARDPRAVVVDWFSASEDQPWRSDHVHPNEAGQAALADLVARAVDCRCPT